MKKDRIEMSQRERDRLKVMAPVMSGERTQSEAARLLKLCVRQVRRLQRRLEAGGDAAIIHGLRGRPSNRRHEESLRRRVVDACRGMLAALGPTMASEKLAALGLAVPKETLRRWLLEEALWQPSRQREKHRQRRERRPCFGELIQADGSEHDWLDRLATAPNARPTGASSASAPPAALAEAKLRPGAEARPVKDKEETSPRDTPTRRRPTRQ